MKTTVAASDLRWALETLWTDAGALARNPLVEQLSLTDGWPEQDKQDAYKRASALINALLAAAQQLEASGAKETFALLNRTYGLERHHRAAGTPRTPPKELATRAGLTIAEYERQLDAALTDLRSVLRSQ